VCSERIRPCNPLLFRNLHYIGGLRAFRTRNDFKLDQDQLDNLSKALARQEAQNPQAVSLGNRPNPCRSETAVGEVVKTAEGGLSELESTHGR
jgi:hypothetical protein